MFLFSYVFQRSFEKLNIKNPTIQKGSKPRSSFVEENHLIWRSLERSPTEDMMQLGYLPNAFSGADFWKSHKLSFVVCNVCKQNKYSGIN